MTARFDFDIERVTGTPGEDAWAQVYDFSEDEIGGKRVVAVLMLAGISGVEAAAKAREVLLVLKERVFATTDLVGLKELVAGLTKLTTDKGEKVFLTVGYFDNNRLKLVAGEGMRVVMVRDGVFGYLAKGAEEEAVGLTGEVKDEDLIIFGTSDFFELIGVGALRAAVGSKQVSEAKETLIPLVAGREKSSGMAAAVVLVRPPAVDVVEPEVLAAVNATAQEVMTAANAVAPEEAGFRRDGVNLGQVVTEKPTRWYARIGKKIFARGGIRVGRPEGRVKVAGQVLAGGLVLALVVVAFLGWQGRQKQESLNKAGGFMATAQKTFEEAKLEAAKGGSWQEKVVEVERNVDEAVSLGLSGQEVDEFRKKIAELRANQEKQKSGKPSIFFELTLIADKAKGSGLVFGNDKLLVADTENNVVYTIDVKQKAHEESAIDKPQVATANQGGFYIAGSKGIYSLTSNTAKLVIPADKWQEVIALGSFGDNVYLLDKGSNQIWKYTASSNGFGAKKAWLAGEVSLAEVKGAAIDGAVWLAEAKAVRKFNYGKEEKFSISNLPGGWSEISWIGTSAVLENLYLWDKGNGQIVTVSKSGEVKSVYVWAGLKEATGVTISSDGKTAYILKGETIYSVFWR